MFVQLEMSESLPVCVSAAERISSDERRSKTFKAPLDAGSGRAIDAVQRLALLRAQLVVCAVVLSVEGLCMMTTQI